MNTQSRSNMVFALFLLSIFMVIVFAGLIVFKIMFWPPCTTIGKDCVVDGWTMAGFAGTVLAVAATVLALLGAFAVAAWWTGLEERVSRLVKDRLATQKAASDQELQKMLDDQDSKIKQAVQIMLRDQEIKANQAVQLMLDTQKSASDQKLQSMLDVQELKIEQTVQTMLTKQKSYIQQEIKVMLDDQKAKIEQGLKDVLAKQEKIISQSVRARNILDNNKKYEGS